MEAKNCHERILSRIFHVSLTTGIVLILVLKDTGNLDILCSVGTALSEDFKAFLSWTRFLFRIKTSLLQWKLVVCGWLLLALFYRFYFLLCRKLYGSWFCRIKRPKEHFGYIWGKIWSVEFFKFTDHTLYIVSRLTSFCGSNIKHVCLIEHVREPVSKINPPSFS